MAQEAVVIDIAVKPGGSPHAINVKSHGNTPVALLCSPSFDPAMVDRTSVRLGNAGAVQCHFADVNMDGCIDLVCHAETAALGVTCDSTELTLVARLHDGTRVTGTDTIVPVPCQD
jgi:hypothetical protein